MYVHHYRSASRGDVPCTFAQEARPRLGLKSQAFVSVWRRRWLGGITTDRTRGRGQCSSHQESKRGIAGLYRSGPRKPGRGRRPRRGRGGRGRGRAWREKSVVSVKELGVAGGARRGSHPPTYIQRNPSPPRLAYKAHTIARFTYHQSPAIILLASLHSPPPSRIT